MNPRVASLLVCTVAASCTGAEPLHVVIPPVAPRVVPPSGPALEGAPPAIAPVPLPLDCVFHDVIDGTAGATAGQEWSHIEVLGAGPTFDGEHAQMLVLDFAGPGEFYDAPLGNHALGVPDQDGRGFAARALLATDACVVEVTHGTIAVSPIAGGRTYRVEAELAGGVAVTTTFSLTQEVP